MGAFFEEIPESLVQWIINQKMFWVATAPLSGEGHVNVSPKGGPYFGVLDTRTFWYMELSGSGSETLSHIYEPGNGRITIQLNAFEGPPRIIRLWGKGKAFERGTKEYDQFVKQHQVETIPATRSIIIVDIHQVGTSCGFSVPFYDFKEYRTTLNDFYANKEKKFAEGNEKENIDRYWAYKNAWSMDGLPGMRMAQRVAKEKSVAPIKKMVGPFAPTAYRAPESLPLEQMVIIFIVAFIAGVLATALGPKYIEKIQPSLIPQLRNIISIS